MSGRNEQEKVLYKEKVLDNCVAFISLGVFYHLNLYILHPICHVRYQDLWRRGRQLNIYNKLISYHPLPTPTSTISTRLKSKQHRTRNRANPHTSLIVARGTSKLRRRTSRRIARRRNNGRRDTSRRSGVRHSGRWTSLDHDA